MNVFEVIYREVHLVYYKMLINEKLDDNEEDFLHEMNDKYEILTSLKKFEVEYLIPHQEYYNQEDMMEGEWKIVEN